MTVPGGEIYPYRGADSAQRDLPSEQPCPGAALILFVCKAAVAHCLEELKIASKGRQLVVNRLPITFPESAARFTTQPSAPAAQLVNAESH